MASSRLDLERLRLVAQKAKNYSDNIEEKFKNEIKETNKLVDAIKIDLTDEISERKNKDTSFQTQLNTEISRATESEGYLKKCLEKETATARVNENENTKSINAINALIPDAATESNKLLDRQTANNLFGNNLGTYRSDWDPQTQTAQDGVPFSGKTLAEAETRLKARWNKYNTVQNDYAFIQYLEVDAEGRSKLITWRYSYIDINSDGKFEWTKQIELSLAQSITDAQYDSMNSGITKYTWAEAQSNIAKAQEDIIQNATNITDEINRAKDAENQLLKDLEEAEAGIDEGINNLKDYTDTYLNDLNTKMTQDYAALDKKRNLLTGHSIKISQKKEHIIDIDLINAEGSSISHQEINLDNEHIIDKVDLDYTNKKLIFTFKDGHSLDCDISSMIDDLNTKIDKETTRATTKENELNKNKVDKTTTIAGIDLNNNIEANELRNGLELGTIYNKNSETVVDILNGTDSNVPNVKQVKDYVNTYGGKIDKIKVNGTESEIVDKVVNITIPTKISDLDADGLGKGNLTINVTKNGETSSTIFNANSNEDKSISITSTVVEKSQSNGYINVDSNEIQVYSDSELKNKINENTTNLNALQNKVDSWVAMTTEEINDIMN